MSYVATKSAVDNRGIPPDGFLDELVAFGKSAVDEIFAPNTHNDVYSLLRNALGPYVSLLHRRCVMLETLRVLAGFESSWRWNCGVDVTNHHSLTNRIGEETGIFQVSYDSLSFNPSLKECVRHYCNGEIGVSQFITEMKSNHSFALEYCARLLRFSYSWDGPLKRNEVSKWVNRDSVTEFEVLLS